MEENNEQLMNMKIISQLYFFEFWKDTQSCNASWDLEDGSIKTWLLQIQAHFISKNVFGPCWLHLTPNLMMFSIEARELRHIGRSLGMVLAGTTHVPSELLKDLKYLKGGSNCCFQLFWFCRMLSCSAHHCHWLRWNSIQYLSMQPPIRQNYNAYNRLRQFWFIEVWTCGNHHPLGFWAAYIDKLAMNLEFSRLRSG